AVISAFEMPELARAAAAATGEDDDDDESTATALEPLDEHTPPEPIQVVFDATPGTEPSPSAEWTPVDHEVKRPAFAAAPPPAAAPRAAVSAPAPRAAPADAADELRVFLRDYAIVSELHLRVIERFSREGIEAVLGRQDIQAAVGGSAPAVAGILEDFVQARL